ncbi:MAG: hypothetical protein J5787_00140 [Alphaproteobacteria bacterium]|nr:hypothetical protein [Alphaproteobacteria bacterium]MBO4644812.1 hypothetical protein [Alphaproteobacteria bacterium]
MDRNDEILMQMTAIGNTLKVTAIHVPTGTEVSFMAPKNTPMLSLKMMARKKLEYVIKKNNQS